MSLIEDGPYPDNISMGAYEALEEERDELQNEVIKLRKAIDKWVEEKDYEIEMFTKADHRLLDKIN